MFPFRTKPNKVQIISIVLIGIILLIGGAFAYSDRYGGALNATVTGGTAEVHFIDVGQGDCALIRTETANVLIDCGELDSYGKVTRYLNRHGVGELDYIVVSHPHTDHMGGMYRIVERYGADRIIMPDVKGLEPDIPLYRRLTDAADRQGIPILYAKAGTSLDLGENCLLEVIAPVSDYDDLNNYSAVVRFVCGAVSFLFTGDIEHEAETDILESGADISAEVLKVPHHGSGTSSLKRFVQAVSPTYAVFSVGENNDYGHPHSNITELYEKLGVSIFRTDMNGSVVFTTDGSTLKVVADR